MARGKTPKLTKYELELMETLWQLKSASVRELQEALPTNRRPAYTTVQTMVYRLEEKGALRRVKKIGNAHIFEPVITRQGTHRRLVEELLELFGGSAQPLMAHLVESGKLTLEDVHELEAGLNAMQRESSKETTSKQARDRNRRGGKR